MALLILYLFLLKKEPIKNHLKTKTGFIPFQFLFEPVILCVIGGIIVLILVWIIASILTKVLEFEFVLVLWNIILGTSLTAGNGLISGILPSITAPKLVPVEAVRIGI